MNTADMEWIRLGLGYTLLGIPLAILYYFRTGLFKPALIAIVRMTAQLLFLGFYLQFIFKINSALLNVAWILVMTVTAGWTIVKRSELRLQLFLIPILGSLFVSLLVTLTPLMLLVLDLENPFDARYLVPITGMLLGNGLNAGIIGIRSFYRGLMEQEELYRFYLASGATEPEALFPFVREAIKTALNPAVANMSNMGLISIPGMMTGQILGGSDPMVAIKYQIMIMVAIHTGSAVNLVLSILFSRKLALNRHRMPNRNRLSEKGRK